MKNLEIGQVGQERDIEVQQVIARNEDHATQL
jgi:hypothetical protein